MGLLNPLSGQMTTKCNPLRLGIPLHIAKTLHGVLLGYSVRLVHAMPVNISITKRMAINLPLSLAADVERLARQDRRSVASWLRNTIEDRVIEALRSEQAADQAVAEIRRDLRERGSGGGVNGGISGGGAVGGSTGDGRS